MLGISMTNMYSISSLPTTLSTIPPTIQHKNNTEKLENNPQERKLIHELKEMNIEDWSNQRVEDEDEQVVREEDNTTVNREEEEEGSKLSRENIWHLYLT